MPAKNYLVISVFAVLISGFFFIFPISGDEYIPQNITPDDPNWIIHITSTPSPVPTPVPVETPDYPSHPNMRSSNQGIDSGARFIKLFGKVNVYNPCSSPEGMPATLNTVLHIGDYVFAEDNSNATIRMSDGLKISLLYKSELLIGDAQECSIPQETTIPGPTGIIPPTWNIPVITPELTQVQPWGEQTSQLTQIPTYIPPTEHPTEVPTIIPTSEVTQQIPTFVPLTQPPTEVQTLIPSGEVTQHLPVTQTITPQPTEGSPVPTPAIPMVTQECLWAGTWQTSFGTMILTQEGISISGSYEHNNGKISGTSSGNEFTGTWQEESGSAASVYSGPVKLTMNDDCNSFTGNWKYASSDTWNGEWTGQRS